MSLENKIALVTGASRGIGQAIALELARQGALVIGTATTQSGAEKIAVTFAQQELTGHGVVLNVADQASTEECFNTIESQFGTPTILVNNAGITRDNLMLRMSYEEWDSIINTNLTSVYRMTKLCLKGMLKAKFGRVINITSIVGATGNPGQANYAAAKAGIIGFTKALAQELASDKRDITINAVAPGFIDTEMTSQLNDEQKATILQKIPMNRLGYPADIANAVSFLASPKAAYITGQTLHINGGMYMN